MTTPPANQPNIANATADTSSAENQTSNTTATSANSQMTAHSLTIRQKFYIDS